jgi:hypothetical protein
VPSCARLASRSGQPASSRAPDARFCSPPGPDGGVNGCRARAGATTSGRPARWWPRCAKSARVVTLDGRRPGVGAPAPHTAGGQARQATFGGRLATFRPRPGHRTRKRRCFQRPAAPHPGLSHQPNQARVALAVGGGPARLHVPSTATSEGGPGPSGRPVEQNRAFEAPPGAGCSVVLTGRAEADNRHRERERSLGTARVRPPRPTWRLGSRCARGIGCGVPRGPHAPQPAPPASGILYPPTVGGTTHRRRASWRGRDFTTTGGAR